MKKVLFMLSSMNIGGVEKSLLSLLSAIPKDKFEITVLLLEKKGGFLEYIPDWVRVEEAVWFENVKPIIMQPPQDTFRRYFNKKQYLKALYFIFIYLVSKFSGNRFIYYKNVLRNIPLNKNIYDIAIAYQGPTDIIDYYIGRRVRAKKKISWVHFDVSKFIINKKLYCKLYTKFNNIFVVSEEAKKRLIETIPTVSDKVDVFLNLISHELIKNMADDQIKFDDDFRGVKIITVGRLSVEKGQDIAIKALYKLRKDGYNIRWYCIGDGNSRREYESLIDYYQLNEDFLLLGPTTNPYPYMLKADIYVQTSRHEGYCLTLAEAKCLNKPIITTNFTGACEQIIDGFNGFIVGCNEEELYSKIKFLINTPDEQTKVMWNLSKASINTMSEVYKLLYLIE
jgi:glycosyltransferase involved in cell wall biosynthesis